MNICALLYIYTLKDKAQPVAAAKARKPMLRVLIYIYKYKH